MGLSLTQILFTVVGIVLAWRVIGFLERRQKLRREDSAARASSPDPKPVAVELKPCPRCGTYVPGGQNCPHCQGERGTWSS